MPTLAINGGEPIRTKSFPTWPTLDPADIEAFESIYNSGRWGVGGAKVPEFAQQFAEFQGANYGVCVNSGTTALYIASKGSGCSSLATKLSPPRIHSKRQLSLF